MFRVLILCLIAVFAVSSVSAQHEQAVRIEAGHYTPLYQNSTGPREIQVAAFTIDATPVTNAQFLAFVEANPEWMRSRVVRAFADEGYLSHWAGDTNPGADVPANHPVVNVSWFAASAYAEWVGGRLPSVAEWEYVAAASETQRNGNEDPTHTRRILDWYSRITTGLRDVGTDFCNVWGACDMHGLIWEHTEDFSSAIVTGDSRSGGNRDVRMFCGAAAMGASDFRDYAAFMRFAFRSALRADYTVTTLGFRVAYDVSPS